MVTITTERLKLRLLNSEDASMILTLLNEPSFINNIGDKGVRDIQGANDYIKNGPLAMQKSLGFSLYCCQLKESSKTIGLSGLIKREGIEHPEVGFAFLPDYQSAGYGYESSKAVLDYAFRELSLTKIQAICNPDNISSKKLLTKLGFDFNHKITLPNGDKEINLYEKELK